MDANAFNYDPFANVILGHDSLGCLYAADWCVNGSGNPFFLNDDCYAWVIEVDEYCCENEWDDICQLTYEHCQEDYPSQELKTLENIISIYPNPTTGKINIMDLKECNTKGYTDIGKQAKDATKYKIAVVPTIIIFKDDEEVARFQADLSFKMVATKEEVQEEINNLLMSDF